MESSLQSRIAGYDGRSSRGPGGDDEDDRNWVEKISGAAGDLTSKVASTVSNLTNSKPSEENPISYKVIHKGGALVRSGYETSSSQVHHFLLARLSALWRFQAVE